MANLVKGKLGLKSDLCDKLSDAGCQVSCYLPDLITITHRIPFLHSTLQSDALWLQPEAHSNLETCKDLAPPPHLILRKEVGKRLPRAFTGKEVAHFTISEYEKS